MDYIFVLIVFISILPTFIKKYLLKDITETEYFLMFSVLATIFTLIECGYKKYIKKEDIKIFGKMKGKKILAVLLVAVVILKFTIGYMKLSFLKKMDVTKYAPLYKSLSLIFTFLIGVWVLGEKRSFDEFMGLLLIVVGMFFIAK